MDEDGDGDGRDVDRKCKSTLKRPTRIQLTYRQASAHAPQQCAPSRSPPNTMHALFSQSKTSVSQYKMFAERDVDT